jgi:hypothetical protein
MRHLPLRALALVVALSGSTARADDAPEPPRPAAAVRLAWSGGSGGIDATGYRFHLHERLGVAGAPALQDIRASYAWMAQGPWRLASAERTFAATAALLDGEAPACVAARPATGLRSADELAIFDDKAPPWTAFWPAERVALSWWTCAFGDATADLVGPEGLDPTTARWSLGAWEARLSTTWTLAPGEDGGVARTIPSIGRPRRDGPRRARQLLDLVEDGVLFADAGRFVAGIGPVRDAAPSAHRAAGFALLRRVGPAALAPGHEELVVGPARLLEEARDLPWVATNWQTRDEALALPPVRVVPVETYGRTVSVGFLSALDPELHQRIPALKQQGVTISDPVPAIHETLERLAADGRRPELVVVLSTAGPDVQARLRRELRGVDLLIGDPADDLARVGAMEIGLRSETARTPTSLPGEPLVLAEAVVGASGGLDALFVQPQPVDLDDAPDPEVLDAVTRTRAALLPPLDVPLLPAPAGPPGSVVTDLAFARVVCEAIRDELGADIVFLPDLTPGDDVPGPMTTLLAAGRLQLSDRLERHIVPGDRLGKLIDQLHQSGMTACGTTLGGRSASVGGRGVEPDLLYRIVTTDRHRDASPLGPLLDAARNPAALGGTGFTLVTDDAGTPRTLRATALAALERLRATHGEDLLTNLLGRRTARPPPRWLFRLRTLSVRIEGFQGADDPAYAQVPETLATSPSSFTLGTAADLSVQFDDHRIGWDARVRHAYTRLRTAALVQETADDLRFSSSVTLPGATTPPILGLSARPFGEGLLDAEWTPITSADGVTLPRQLDLSFTLGLAAQPKGLLRTLRLGVLGMQDLSRTDKRANRGGRVEAEVVVPFGLGLRWANQLNAIVYANTRDQDARDLRFRALLDSRVTMPLLRGLDVAFYGNLFVFQGRVPETSAIRRSFTVGASLDARGVFELGRRSR